MVASQVLKVPRKHGFALVAQSGSHQKWRNPASGRQVILPYHRGRTLPPRDHEGDYRGKRDSSIGMA